MDEKRVKAFEDMLKSILSQYDSTVEKVAKLKAEGKEKTVTYRHFFANKLQLQAITIFKTKKLLISSLIQCLLKQKWRKIMKIISLFGGCGGLDLWFEKAGFEIPVAETPTEIIAMKFKKGSKTTVEIYMDNVWAFSFRIHSASTRVQPSLKFDVQFISTPASVLHIECKWNNK